MRPPRTLLEQKIRERRQTLEEFAESAERFARDHGEAGTLGVRHLQRLVSGRGPNGRPLGPVRPATARLLEKMLDAKIEELLSPVTSPAATDEPANELRQMLHTSRQVDDQVLNLLREQLATIRRFDRQLGAVMAHEEACLKAAQVSTLLTHSLPGTVREQLAALLSELHTLAGWQALDLRKTNSSWQHYEQAKRAARESRLESYEIHTAAEQAFVLLDIGETKAATELLEAARNRSKAGSPPVLNSWLAAAHGEALAADNQPANSLRAFDTASKLLPTDSINLDGPYVALDSVHLGRWRGHALARFGAPEAIETLTSALNELDPTFVRAETSLRIDLARAFAAADNYEAVKPQVSMASSLAENIGSVRQQRRIAALECG
ncbi:hypothetical protein GCM10027597_41720 [Saccharopolyspora tripterygii]